jgi:hypothetical protein
MAFMGVIQAQTRETNKLNTVPGIALRIFAPQAAPEDCPQLAIVGTEGKIVRLNFLRFNISLPYIQEASTSLKIYDYNALNGAMANKQALPAPIAEFPANGKQSAILVLLGTDAKSWKWTVFFDDDKSFPGASRMFLNLTPYPLHGTVGDIKFQISANGSGIVIAAGATGEDSSRPVRLWGNYQGKEISIVSNFWDFYPERRGIVIVWQKSEGDFRLNSVSDIVSNKTTALK